MRKEYRRAATRLLAKTLEERSPGFGRVKVASDLLLGGETVFRWRPCERVHAFVLLVPHPSGHQAFTLEVAWSARARFPEGTSRPTIFLGLEDPDPVHVPEGILRIGDLDGRKDRWWHLPDPAMERPGDITALQESLEPIDAGEAEKRVSSRIAAALESLERSGMPFLEAIALRWCRGAPRSEEGTESE